VNSAQIRSAVPEIFHAQIKHPENDGAKSRTFRSSLRAVKTVKLISKVRQFIYGSRIDLGEYYRTHNGLLPNGVRSRSCDL